MLDGIKKRLFRPSIPPAAGREEAAASAADPAIEPVVESISRTSNMLLGDAPAQDIFDDMVRFIAEDAGLTLVILRVAKPGGDVFEVRAAVGLGDSLHSSPHSFSVGRMALLDLCSRGERCGGGFVVGSESAPRGHEAPVPQCVEWRKDGIFIFNIEDNGNLAGFITAGFFEGAPGGRTMSLLKLLANGVLMALQRDRAKELLREKERALAVCKEELESVNQLKSNFLSVVSHELRTPLTSVKAYTETLLDNVDTIKRETLQDFLRVMDEESERIIKLVDNILNYSRMETGHLRVERTSCNLNRIVEQVHGTLRAKFLARNINTELRLPRHTCRIDADQELVTQLLQNLMSNAAKFTPEGGKVTVTLEEEASAARIVVQDTGTGIPEDQLEKIFERFYQVDASNTREHGGSGLGLAICKNIVDWHDGKIWVENVKDSGAKFVVLLPMKDIVVRQSVSAGFIGSRRFERERYLQLLVEMLSEFLQAHKASIMLLEQDQQILRIVAAKGLDSEFVQNTRLEVGDRIAGKVAQTGEPLHVFDIENDTEYGRANNTLFYGTRSFISTPLKDGDEVVGVLNVSDHVEGREFTRADRELLEALGGIIVGMLKKLDAYEKVSENFEKLKEAMRASLDMREAWGSGNLLNLTLIALTIGKKLALDERSLTALRLGMNLYDLGLMRIPRNIRMKKEALSPKEREVLREHTNIGFALTSPMGLEDRIMKMIRSHHEHYDGSGYPDGLVGTEIPIEARIVSVVDALRALMSEGPYRRPYSLAEARAEIGRGSSTRFDPLVVQAFSDALDILEARDDGHELVLEAFEKELQRERIERKKNVETLQRETAKEEAR
ncbi:MAG: ATP-binding protein [Candidatus Krumholzibacteria bacterium]|nr:ATP-binding protein [Candidatus Krumholzibacteria bacterium]